jgi:phosphatidate phosphatase APP1
VLARPARVDVGRGGLVIQAYRGYGTADQVILMGRVFTQPQFGSSLRERPLGRDVIDVVRRILRRGVADAVLTALFGGAEQRLITDKDGYFRVHMRLAQPPASNSLWHELDLRLIRPGQSTVGCKAAFFVPPSSARYVVISDIDDTVMYTGVANKAKMLWRLFVEKAHSRIAFPGLAAFYNALHCGASGIEFNPMLYVSRGPWSIYEVLEEFFHLHDIPVGPILFLREWGLTLQRPLPRRAAGHKLELIQDMLALYRDLPFILIGDSGQHDPEIYTRVVRENPGRVLAAYIRNVSRDSERLRAIEALAAEVVDLGSSLVVAADSFAMAEHAARHALISAKALTEVLDERREEGEPDVKPTRRVQPASSREGQAELEEALEEENREGPNVVVEPGKKDEKP